MQNSRERKKKITGRRWYSDKDCSRHGKHEGEDQRKDLGFVDCPRKKKKKKKEAKQSKKKTLNHRSLDSTSNQPSLALTLCLEGGKKEKKQKGRRVVKRRVGARARGWKACVAISRIEFLPFATVQFRGLLEMRRNFEGRREGERGGGRRERRDARGSASLCVHSLPLWAFRDGMLDDHANGLQFGLRF